MTLHELLLLSILFGDLVKKEIPAFFLKHVQTEYKSFFWSVNDDIRGSSMDFLMVSKVHSG